MKIHSYVVARDYGFAPNPFNGFCTLATCKPIIRKSANIGDIVIGTRASPREYEIVFFMKISEILTFEQYWNDPRFENKKPNLYSGKKQAFGDNIYHKDLNENWIQEDSHHTDYDGSQIKANIEKDTSGINVLISTDFCYWGENSIHIPPNLYSIKKIGPGHKSDFSQSLKDSAVAWLNNQPTGFRGKPIDWK